MQIDYVVGDPIKCVFLGPIVHADSLFFWLGDPTKIYKALAFKEMAGSLFVQILPEADGWAFAKRFRKVITPKTSIEVFTKMLHKDSVKIEEPVT